MTERPTNIQHPENKDIIVFIKAKDFIKLRAYVEQVNTEISGFARVDSLDGGHFQVSNFKIFKQVNTAGHTEMEEEAISEWILEAVKDGLDVNKELKCWWHSHCKMGTFWSGIDEKQIEDHDTEMEEDNWKLSLETNHAGSLIARLDVYYPARYTISGLTVKVDYTDDEIYTTCKEEIDEKCEEYVYKAPAYTNYHSYPQYSKKKSNSQMDMEEWEEWEKELKASETKKETTNQTIVKANQVGSDYDHMQGWNTNHYPHQKKTFTQNETEEIPEEIPTEDFEKEMESLAHSPDESLPGQQVLLPQNTLSLEDLPQNTPDPQSEKRMTQAWDHANPDTKNSKIWIPERGD